MENPKEFLSSGKSDTNEVHRNKRESGLLKPAILFIMLSWVMLLSSCVVFVPSHRHHPHDRVIIEHHDRDENFDHH
jgi:hypothetical protein